VSTGRLVRPSAHTGASGSRSLADGTVLHLIVRGDPGHRQIDGVEPAGSPPLRLGVEAGLTTIILGELVPYECFYQRRCCTPSCVATSTSLVCDLIHLAHLLDRTDSLSLSGLFHLSGRFHLSA